MELLTKQLDETFISSVNAGKTPREAVEAAFCFLEQNSCAFKKNCGFYGQNSMADAYVRYCSQLYWENVPSPGQATCSYLWYRGLVHARINLIREYIRGELAVSREEFLDAMVLFLPHEMLGKKLVMRSS